ncbi:hypothetical protein NIES4071_67590 [Calothrix sp. NIES-4071]|nr:hypothetical protein NIES4071_67590 [Calothrix sp. NIES-4071]BAZ61037.1 hypothetical protein NIES4105_67550 [Calothrix sp. NIES-4105]
MQKGYEQGWREGFKEGFKIGIEEGRKLGMQQQAAYLVLLQLQHRFGDLGQSQQERIQGLSKDTLEDLIEAQLDFTSIADLACARK